MGTWLDQDQHRGGRVVVVGSVNMDLTVRTPVLPAPGETVLGGDLQRSPGGKGANQAVAAARLGAPVRFVGCVGADPFGEELLESLRAAGVDLSCTVAIPGRATGAALIAVDVAGENLIVVAPGANAALAPSVVSAALDDLGAGDVLLLQLEIPVETVRFAARRGHRAGARVVLNAAPAAALDGEMLGLLDVLVVNAGEASALSGRIAPGESAGELRRRGPAVVVVTLGGEGLLLDDGQHQRRLPACDVQVVDTTGAGDAFCGAFAAELAAGREAHAAAAWANVAAGLATTRPGAQSSLPTRAEVQAWYASTPATGTR